jgi:hypothetical protein
MPNMADQESQFMRPLSVEAILALILACVNLALDQADIHNIFVSWLSVVACISLSADALRRSEWVRHPQWGRLRIFSGMLAIIGGFAAFGWFLTTHRKHETAVQPVAMLLPEKHEQSKPHDTIPPVRKLNSEGKLIRAALDLAAKIRKLHQDWLSEKTKIDGAIGVTEAQRTSMRAVWGNKVMAEYDGKYKVDARLIHEKLLARLPSGSDSLVSNDLYMNEVNPDLLGIIADNLERLAKLLRGS